MCVKLSDKIRNIQVNNVIGFELFFINEINIKELLDLTNMKYWMLLNPCANNDFYDIRGVEMPSFDILYLIIHKDKKSGYLSIPNCSPIEVLIRFAKRFKCYVYFNGELLFSGLTLSNIENKLQRELTNEEMKQTIDMIGDNMNENEIIECLLNEENNSNV